MLAGLAVAVGGALGAVVRYQVGRWLSGSGRGGIAWGTLAVNLVGSLVLGVVLGAGLSGWPAALIGAGFCGGLSTFSTFSAELLELAERRAWLCAVAYAAGSIGLGLLACLGGMAIGGLL